MEAEVGAAEAQVQVQVVDTLLAAVDTLPAVEVTQVAGAMGLWQPRPP